MHKTNK